MQTQNEKFFTLFSKAGSNVVESAAILHGVPAAPHERQAKLAKRSARYGTHRGRPREPCWPAVLDPASVAGHGVAPQELGHPSCDGFGTLDVQEMADAIDRAVLDVRE